MNLIPTWPIAAGTLVIGLIAGAGITASIKNGKIERIEAKHVKEIAAWKDAQALALANFHETESKYRDRERIIRESTDQSLQAKEDEKNRIAARLDVAISSLQNRPSRPPASAGPVSPVAADCKGATGAGIYAEDAIAALRESSRADRLRAALAQCYAQYDAARALTNRPATQAD